MNYFFPWWAYRCIRKNEGNKEDNMRKYIVTDITYCARDCANTECKRNKKHVENYNGFLSWANFVDCKEWKDEQNNDN